MTRDDTIRMAREAGFSMENSAATQAAERFAALVAAHDRGQYTVTAPSTRPARWREIETAPKDEIILLGLPFIGNIREGDRRVYEGRWHEEQSTWTSVNGFLLLGAATHWMPLPTAPIKGAA